MQFDIDVFARLMDSYDRISTHDYLGDHEVWLNRADWNALGQPVYLAGQRVHLSIGVPAGKLIVFDRRRGAYLRDPAAK